MSAHSEASSGEDELSDNPSEHDLSDLEGGDGADQESSFSQACPFCSVLCQSRWTYKRHIKGEGTYCAKSTQVPGVYMYIAKVRFFVRLVYDVDPAPPHAHRALAHGNL